MLLYLLKHSRIDLGNPVRELTKVLKSHALLAYKEMLKIIKFVLDTATMGLKLVPTFTKDQLEWRLLGASASDWANDKDNRKSNMAFILFLNGISILWRSKQASIVALSTAEAEHIALSELAKEILFVVQILHSLGIPVQTPITVHVDNMGAIFMFENAWCHSWSCQHLKRTEGVGNVVLGWEPVECLGFGNGNMLEQYARDVVVR